MLILIAESKTMRSDVASVTPDQYTRHCPVFESVADTTARFLRTLPLPELAERLRLGPKSSADAFKAYYDFPDKSTGLQAIEAFTGVVFRNLSYKSLTESQHAFTADNVGIISSLYGFLRPDDIVKPYRLDFNSPVMNGTSNTPMRFWPTPLTDQLIKIVSSGRHSHILNLLPKDAATCIDWKRVTNHASVITIDFKIQRADSLVTPQAGSLKTMRGQLLRQIILNHITDPAGLAGLETESSHNADGLQPDGHMLFVGV